MVSWESQNLPISWVFLGSSPVGSMSLTSQGNTEVLVLVVVVVVAVAS